MKTRKRARRGLGTMLARALTLLRMLQTRRTGITIREAAEDLQTSTRTVYRDLAALQEAGFLLTSTTEGELVRWRLFRERRGK